MKKVFGLLLTGLLALNTALAQDENIMEKFAIPLSRPGKRGKVELGQINGDIIVTGYTGQEVIVSATAVGGTKSADSKDAKSEVPPGMKRINANPLEISAKEQNNTVYINSESWKRKINVNIQVPMDFDLELSTVHGQIVIENVNGAIEVSSVNGPVEMTSVSGSVLANSVNGTIKALFKSVTAGEPMSFVTLNGDVDVTLPASVKATTKMRSERGEIYTDFDMVLEKSKPNVNKEDGEYQVSINTWVYGKINGGGPEYTFKNMNGSVIVRKGS